MAFFVIPLDTLLKAKRFLSFYGLSLFVHYLRHSVKDAEHHKSGVENRFFYYFD